VFENLPGRWSGTAAASVFTITKPFSQIVANPTLSETLYKIMAVESRKYVVSYKVSSLKNSM